MPKSGFVRILAALVCLFAFGVVSCASKFSEERVEQTGTLSAALVAIGSDGAAYAFPSSTKLLLSSGGRTVKHSLAGDSLSLSMKLAVGSYTLGLEFPNDRVELKQSGQNGENYVPVEWTDPQPMTFTIVEETDTFVTLHFSVPQLAKIKFAKGELDVSMNVDVDLRGTPSRVRFSGDPVTTTAFSFADPSAAYATYFADTVGSTSDFEMQVVTTGPWTIKVDAVCIPVTTTGALIGYANTTTSLVRRVRQLFPGGSGELCIVDAGETNDVAELRLMASGPAPLDQQGVLPDASYLRELVITSPIPNMFDGFELDQAVAQLHPPISGATIHHRLATASNTTITTFDATFNGYFALIP